MSVVARHAALGEPAREELLGAAVAPRDVDVADAGGAGGVEQLGGARVERVGRALRRQVVRAAERDVAGPPDGGEAEAEARDREARCAPSARSARAVTSGTAPRRDAVRCAR